jgi:hypothetical protein
MDSFLIKYLQSGKAWVLVGSGPSIAMGYPSWKKLASFAAELAAVEQRGHDLRNLNSALANGDYPLVFQEAKNILGAARLLQHLREKNKPSGKGRIYELIAQWPIPVYLTTNYDDELQKHLGRLGESYTAYSNSEDHINLLAQSLSGAIFKLHGDLRSETGLILTKEQYGEIEKGENWQYWRTKMTSVFQMNPVIVIGHSLTDTNVRHVLEASKQGAGIEQPVCWIAPDVSYQESRDFLEKYRIRVIPYDNRDGEHKNLLKLIENINEFIPARPIVRIQEQIERVSISPLGDNAAAPGFFVFNIFAQKGDFEEKRIDIVAGAIVSTLPELSAIGEFTLRDALNMTGWPADVSPDSEFLKKIEDRAIEQEILIPVDGKFKVNNKAEALAQENRKSYSALRDRFKQALLLRLRRDYSGLNEAQASTVAADIEASLTGYFREGGLSLASTLFSSRHYGNVPSSIIPFITMASARYDDLLMRQAFFTVSVDSFSHSTSVDRDYLGRISQGFFAFHALGVFGDVAIERLRDAKQTVWLIDSSAQIRALALAAPANVAYRECISRLCGLRIRFFTPYSLFQETLEHLWFADKVIKEVGADSPLVIAAARGEAPYPKENEFLQGFIRWQATGNRCDWQNYLFEISGQNKFSEGAIRDALSKIGVEVIDLKDWPGFTDLDHAEVEDYTKRIAGVWEEKQTGLPAVVSDQLADSYQKAKPEAEALIIVKREREGRYYIISEEKQRSASWFISSTSILNIVEQGTRITWSPEAFLRFSSTLCDISASESADYAFETLVLGLAEFGLNLLDEDILARVFGTAIDQTKLSIDGLRESYHTTLEAKYGESPDSVIARLPPSYRPLALIQLTNEVQQVAERKQQIAEEAEKRAARRAKAAEEELEGVKRYRAKVAARRQRAKVKARRQKAVRRKKKKGRKKGRK